MQILGQVPTKNPKLVSYVRTQALWPNVVLAQPTNSFMFGFLQPRYEVEHLEAVRLIYTLPKSVVLNCALTFIAFYSTKSAPKLHFTDVDPTTGATVRFLFGQEGIEQMFSYVADHTINIDARGRFCGPYTFHNQSGACYLRPYGGPLNELQPCQPVYA